MTNRPSATAHDVHYSVGGKQILHGIDIEVHPGELVVLVGPNGAGKSTALAVLVGDIVPDSGTVTLDGRPLPTVSIAERSRLRSMMLQQTVPTFAYRVSEIVEMAREPWRRKQTGPIPPVTQELDEQHIVVDALIQTQTAHLADRDITTLSGGELQRVNLSRVLAQRCPVVFLDEPTDALDIAHQENVMRLIRGLAESGHAVVAVLHDLGLAAAYATRIIMIDDGRVVAAGSPEEVFTAERLSATYGHPIEVAVHQASGNLSIVPIRTDTRKSNGCTERAGYP